MLPSFGLQRDEDRGRFTRLYKQNQSRLHRLAARLLGPGPRAEDAVHDTVIKLIQNTALDALRKEGREVGLEARLPEPAAPPDQGEFETLVSLIRAMPEDYRRVLELRFVAEWSLSDIAEALGLTEGAVKSRIFRGRKLLIDALRREGYLDGRSCI